MSNRTVGIIDAEIDAIKVIFQIGLLIWGQGFDNSTELLNRTFILLQIQVIIPFL